MNYRKIHQVYTSESVTSGHPDKVCDQISDAILDECLKQDPKTRSAVECFGGHGRLFIGGEVTTKAEVNYKGVAKEVYNSIGYKDDIEIKDHIALQSPDISQGVDTGGAGDQGIMYGFACAENDKFLPTGVVYAHALAKRLEEVRKNGEIEWLMPDGKTQVTLDGEEVSTVLVSCQHKKDISQEEIKKEIKEKVIKPVIGRDLDGLKILINPTGSFIPGGFEADAGLTGRKIMVDSYGGLVSHGGGCFSGKDPTKVDRSAAYMARFAAKNIVANGLAKECLVSVAYAIGEENPVMVRAVDEEGSSLDEVLNRNFDFRPKAITERLDLLRPIYRQTAAYGHFGKDGLSWEKIEKIS